MCKIICFFVAAVFVCAASSRRLPAAPIPPPCPQKSVLATINDLLVLSNALEDKPSGCGCTKKIPSSCGCQKSCSCQNKSSYIDVILPPAAAELPCGLGYLPSSAPLVAYAYGCTNACDACVPVTSPYSCTCIATPIPAEIRALAKPVIL